MKVKELQYIQGDEKLASPVYTKEGELLIPEGTVLKKEYVDLLVSLEIEVVEIEDEYSSYESPVLLLSEEKRSSYIERIQKLLENHIYSERDSLSTVKELALDLIECVDQIDLNLIYDIPCKKADMYEHTLNVTIFSLLAAKKLELPKENYYGIAVGALLHDLGLRYITIPYLNCDVDKGSPEEVFEYKKHTVLAYTVLDGEEEWLPNSSKSMILSHHEKMDGSGFPLKQKKQSIECRIIQLCDTFECLISGMECERYPMDQVMEYLLSEAGKKYDADVIKALFSMIAKYPVGTEVELSDQRFGIVSRQSDVTDRPEVILLKKLNGGIADDEVLKLKENEDIYIQKIV